VPLVIWVLKDTLPNGLAVLFCNEGQPGLTGSEAAEISISSLGKHAPGTETIYGSYVMFWRLCLFVRFRQPLAGLDCRKTAGS